MFSKFKKFREVFILKKILLNPGPTNTYFSTKLAQWIGSDVCHREHSFFNVLNDLQDRLLSQVYTSNKHSAKVAIMAGSGTTAMESMISSLVDDGVYVINAGKYGKRAIKMMETYNIQYNEIVSKNINDLQPRDDIKTLYFVENETTTGEKYELQKMISLYPKAKFYIDATSAFGASSYQPYEDKIISLCFCSNKCLQSTPGLGVVIWDGLKNTHKRMFFADLEKYGKNKLPFTLPTQAVYALAKAIDTSLNNKNIFDKRKNKIINSFAKIGIKCINTNPSNSIIGFVHPKMNYENLSQHLAKQNIIIYSQVPGIKNSFRVATMSVVFDKHFDKIIEAFYETCVC
tara:strand:+ start:717 stop:1751 length:1035 start_codon:yes stop_codon:yes gene_type:complete